MSTCSTCSGLRVVGPPAKLCGACHGSGTSVPSTDQEGRRELWRELTRWLSYPSLTPDQASRLADVAEVLVVGWTFPGDGRLAALTGVRAYLDAGLATAAREFFAKHSSLMTDSDRLTLRLEMRRVERGARVLEGLRG